MPRTEAEVVRVVLERPDVEHLRELLEDRDDGSYIFHDACLACERLRRAVATAEPHSISDAA